MNFKAAYSMARLEQRESTLVALIGLSKVAKKYGIKWNEDVSSLMPLARKCLTSSDGTEPLVYRIAIRKARAKRMSYFRNEPARPQSGSTKSGNDYIAMILWQHRKECGKTVVR